MRVGQPISKAYVAAKNLVSERNSSLNVHTNFGFGIGFAFREDLQLISSSNEMIIKPGMVFHARITLSGVHNEAARSVIAIGDTVMIAEDGSVTNLTAGIQKKYSEISYSLDDDEEEEAPQPEP